VKYAASISQLSVAFKGGMQKKVSTDKRKRAFDRRVCDAAKLDEFPPVHVMKEAVSKAMSTLHHIDQLHKDSEHLPKSVQTAANAALVGILWLNGFGGRKKEWEIMLRAHCQDQLSQGLDHFVCNSHKTSNTYGGLAKWVAPGTVHAIKVYLGLPCRAGVKTLFVPPYADTDHISITKAFGKFCKAYLPEDCNNPTVNLMRKWYHTELYRLTKTEDKLLGLMRSIDAHSKEVAKKHYVLQSPADDARLAQALVHSMIGQPVSWPSANDLQDITKISVPYLQLVQLTDGEQHDEADDEDAPESEWIWWEGASTFGLPKPFLALQGDTGMAA
jgi:hypothetical protein